MPKQLSDSLLTRSSTGLYGLLIALYPQSFRHEYGPHMAQVFRDCCRETYRKDGPLGMVSLWAFTLLDLFKSVVEEHMHKETAMSKANFVRLSGWGLVVAGLSHALGIFASTGQSFLWRNLGVRYATSDSVVAVLVVGSAVLLVTGVLGLFLRYQDQIDRGGKITLMGGMVFGILNALVSLPLLLTESDLVWTLWFSSFLLMFLSLTVLGLLALGKGWMKRREELALLACAAWPVAGIVVIVLEQIFPPWQIPFTEAIAGTAAVINAAALIVLGYSLQANFVVEAAPTGSAS